jgi:hypothetical protein
MRAPDRLAGLVGKQAALGLDHDLAMQGAAVGEHQRNAVRALFARRDLHRPLDMHAGRAGGGRQCLHQRAVTADIAKLGQ